MPDRPLHKSLWTLVQVGCAIYWWCLAVGKFREGDALLGVGLICAGMFMLPSSERGCRG